ncbi:SAUR-like auxin-responsive protein family protein [Tanacetum coccineum]|uniref:SAUR-like auxin-responsive protein family protein n=1 Tax=Tanacetum coccineum TaxID=301880 RepID=A0ABQ5BXA4_9ASTR
MGAFRFQSLVSNAKQLIKLNSKHQRDVPKGYLAVYVGEDQRKRFVVPLSYLDQPLFQELLRRSEEDFGFNHPMGGLTIPCHEEAFPKSEKEDNFSSLNYETCNWLLRWTKASSRHRMSLVSSAKQLIKLNSKHQRDVPKGYLAVYVGEDQRKRFVVPLSYLDQPLFQELLRRSEEDFGFSHPMGGLTIPCHEEAFVHLTNQLHIL